MIKVLWLDDDFASVTLNDDEGVQLRKKNFQDTAEDAFEYNIDYDPALDLKEFVQKLEEENHYDAVILDILGLNPEDSTDETIMYKAVEYIKGYHGLLCYVFSNNIESHKGFLETHLSGKYFEKRHSSDLFNKVKEDIDSNSSYFMGREYILESVQKGWIDRTIKNSFLDKLMKTYINHEIDTPHGNDMRNVVVPMLERIVKEFEKDPANIGMLTKRGKDDTGRPSDIAMNLAQKDPDSKHMEGSLLHLIKASNSESHGAIDDEDRSLFFESDFNTFFLVCKWFYKKMCSFSVQNPIVENPTAEDSLVKTSIALQSKEYNSIPVRVYKDNNGIFKLDVDVQLPKNFQKENPSYVYVKRIQPNKKNPSVWSAIIDDSKPFELEDDKPSSTTYSIGEKLIEAWNKKKI